MPQTYIMSLGEIVRIDIAKGVNKLAEYILKPSSSESKSELKLEKSDVLKKIGRLATPEIEKFKLGLLSETEFNTLFITKLKDEFNVTLTVEQLNECWNAMNPPFDEYADKLKDVIDYSQQPGQEIIIVSFTNPKDTRFFMDQLQKNGIAFKCNEEDQLIEIAGIKFYSTYLTKQTKADLIAKITSDLTPKPLATPSTSPLAKLSIHASKPNIESKKQNICYIYGTNRIGDELIAQQEAFKKDTLAALTVAQDLCIEVRLLDLTIRLKKFFETDPKDIVKYKSLISSL